MIVVLLAFSIALSIYEKHKRQVIVDATEERPQSEPDREDMRVNDVLRSTGFDGHPGY